MDRSFDSHRNVVPDCQSGYGLDSIEDMDAKQIVGALAALGQETRLEVFRLLVQRGPNGLPAGAIAQALDLPPSSLTFHLQQLAHAGLVTQRRLSRQIIYAVDVAAMNAIMGYLTENCCGGNPALCAPQCAPAKPSPVIRRKGRAA
jgi:ArsR family transcriptional regulator, arsenate/arsenite/antimonite-responsive transcriptional repressor